MKGKWERDLRKHSWLREKTARKEETRGANNLWHTFSLRKHKKKSPHEAKDCSVRREQAWKADFWVQHFVDAWDLTAKVSKRSDGDFFKYIIIIAFRPGGGKNLMLLKAKDEQPVWGPAQQGYLPQRASALVPRASLEEHISLNSWAGRRHSLSSAA